MARKRLTREESKAKTQERLLEATAEAFAQHGFEGASLEEITETAGFSRGAFYSNFKSKDELFLTLIEQHLTKIAEELQTAISGSAITPQEILKAFRNYCTALRKVDKESSLLIAKAQLYAVRHTKFRNKLNALLLQLQQGVRTSLEGFHQKTKMRGKATPDLLAFIGLALSQGLILYNRMDPKNNPDESVETALGAVFDLLIDTSGAEAVVLPH